MINKDMFFKVLKKWEAVIAGEPEYEAYDCEFCLTFSECTGCPVQQVTGEPYCKHSPYKEFAYHASTDGHPKYYGAKFAKSKEAIYAAERMLEFLNCVTEYHFKRSRLK